MKRSRGFFSKATKRLKAKERLTATRLIKDFKQGEKVIIDINTSHQMHTQTIPSPRYRGRVGKIIEKRGSNYVVEIKDGGKLKKIISHPAHLKRVQQPETQPKTREGEEK